MSDQSPSDRRRFKWNPKQTVGDLVLYVSGWTAICGVVISIFGNPLDKFASAQDLEDYKRGVTTQLDTLYRDVGGIALSVDKVQELQLEGQLQALIAQAADPRLPQQVRDVLSNQRAMTDQRLREVKQRIASREANPR